MNKINDITKNTCLDTNLILKYNQIYIWIHSEHKIDIIELTKIFCTLRLAGIDILSQSCRLTQKDSLNLSWSPPYRNGA